MSTSRQPVDARAEHVQKIERLLEHRPPLLDPSILRRYVKQHLANRERYLAIWNEQGRQPLYVFDRESLLRAATAFCDAFSSRMDDVEFFYAVKSNNYPGTARALVEAGFGLDVSSGAELETALTVGAQRIAFSGPGKTDRELKLAIANADRVVVLIDSFGELERLSLLSVFAKRTVRAGVRITPPGPHGWRKFGVPIGRLREFWALAERIRSVDLQGIQFHTSWNLDPSAQLATLDALRLELAAWPERYLAQLQFLDIGGGFWPSQGEWLHDVATEGGAVRAALSVDVQDPLAHYHLEAQPLSRFASALSTAFKSMIQPLAASCRMCVEPGRWISNSAMHLLISVADRKECDLVITDAGTNAVGWERFEHDYVPVLNLTRPAFVERPCLLCGSLCTPHDIWGYSYWGADIQRGDVLLIPDQGAYTYSLRQEFIKTLPRVAQPADA